MSVLRPTCSTRRVRSRDGSLDPFAEPAEHHRPRRPHEIRLLLAGYELVHLDMTPGVRRGEPGVGVTLAAGNRQPLVLEIPLHHNQIGPMDERIDAANVRTPLQRAREVAISVDADRDAEPTAVQIGIGETPEHDVSIHCNVRRRDHDQLCPRLCRSAFRQIIQALTENADVDRITFTGESGTGRIIGATAAANLTPVSLELGGKGANIVFDDAELDNAVDWSVQAIFRNAGQVCLAGSRLFVQRGIYDEFLTRFIEATEALKIGDPSDDTTEFGPLASESHYTKVCGYLDLVDTEGGKIRTGGVGDG